MNMIVPLPWVALRIQSDVKCASSMQIIVHANIPHTPVPTNKKWVKMTHFWVGNFTSKQQNLFPKQMKISEQIREDRRNFFFQTGRKTNIEHIRKMSTKKRRKTDQKPSFDPRIDEITFHFFIAFGFLFRFPKQEIKSEGQSEKWFHRFMDQTTVLGRFSIAFHFSLFGRHFSYMGGVSHFTILRLLNNF